MIPGFRHAIIALVARFIYVRYASSLVKEGVQLLHGVSALFLLVSIMSEIMYLTILAIRSKIGKGSKEKVWKFPYFR